MIRLADRCSLLVAGALLGFAAARAGEGVGDSRPGPDSGRATISASASAAGAASGQDAAPPKSRIDDALPPGLVPRTRAVSAVGSPLTDDEVDRCLLVARDINPDLHAGLIALRQADPAQFRSQLESSARLRALARLERDTPHVYQLKLIELRNGQTVKRLIGDLQAAARSSDETSVESLTEQLRTEMRIEQAFRLLGRKEYLDQLRDRLERLESEYRRDVTTVDERIAARIDLLVAEARSGGPGSGPKTPPPAGSRRAGPGDGDGDDAPRPTPSPAP